MQLSHVVPVNHLELSGLGDFDFCLAHVALQNEDYKRFFMQQIAQGREVYLDNGVWERGEPLDAKDMIQLTIEMQPTYVYAPDYMNDSKATIEAALAFGNKASVYSDFRAHIICVSQGKTERDWFSCVRQLTELPKHCCHTIAINTLFIDDMYENETREGARRTKSRIALLHSLQTFLPNLEVKRFYATGFGAPICARELNKFSWITGADTAIASVLALNHRKIDEKMATHFKPKGVIDGDFTFTDLQYTIAVKNMLILNAWAVGGEPFYGQ